MDSLFQNKFNVCLKNNSNNKKANQRYEINITSIASGPNSSCDNSSEDFDEDFKQEDDSDHFIKSEGSDNNKSFSALLKNKTFTIDNILGLDRHKCGKSNEVKTSEGDDDGDQSSVNGICVKPIPVLLQGLNSITGEC
jgi:hypothetical protein